MNSWLNGYLSGELHPTKNSHIEVRFLTDSSNKKIWWVCDKGHEWEASVGSRVGKRTGCPYCLNKKVWAGFNDLETLYPEIAAQWNYEKNSSLLPSQISKGSGKKVWWICEKKHEWEAVVGSRTNLKSKCPVCAEALKLKKKLLPAGKDPLEITHPELLEQWNYRKNVLKPADLTAGSETKIWWICGKGHEWITSPYKRTARKQNCPTCAGRKVIVGENDLTIKYPHLANEWHPTKNDKNFYDVTVQSRYKAWWLGECGHEWETHVYSRTRKHNPSGCPQCSFRVSQPEKDLQNFLSELQLDCINNKRIIAPYELDIYIPEKNFAVEYNGLYWHTENQGKGKYYHYDKWKACKDKGIQLIQVWEDDWNRNPELVKRMLAHKLGFSQELRVQGRKLIIREITTDAVNEFLNEYHIQGAVDGGIRVGLFENITVSKPFQDKPVAVMVLKREPGTGGKTLNLLRYATSKNVVGGFTKLLKHVEKEFKPESIVTFSDNCVSDGGLYENNGFTAVQELKPDYMYVVRGERVHKFSYRLKRFRDDPELTFEEGLSERELAQLNGLSRIWDAGKTKWRKLI